MKSYSMKQREKLIALTWCPGVLAQGTFIYNWTVFIPRIWCPMWDNILLGDTTRTQAGNFISSDNCWGHFCSSDKSQLVPNLIHLLQKYLKLKLYFKVIFRGKWKEGNKNITDFLYPKNWMREKFFKNIFVLYLIDPSLNLIVGFTLLFASPIHASARLPA